MSTRSIDRVVVALDPASDNRIAIDAAVLLARRLGVALEGVFVEDINLLHYASLPFARIVRHGTRGDEPLNPQNMEQALHRQGQRLQRLVNEIAAQSQLSAAFRTLRGEVVSALASVSTPHDLLVINRAASRRAQRQLGRTARSLMSTVTASVLVLHPSRGLERPVVVLFDGTGQGLRALQLGIELAQQDERHLSVLYPAVDDIHARQLRQTVDEQLATTGIQATHLALRANTPAEIGRAFFQVAGRVLLLDAQYPYLDAGAFEHLVCQLPAPVLLVR